MSLASKLIHYYPEAQWSLNGEDYAGLAWQGENKPTEDEIGALAWPPTASTDPSDYPLLPWQFSALVNYLGKDADIRTAIAAIPDAMQGAAALARYEKSVSYNFSDPLVSQLRQAIGMSVETLSAAWMQAKDLRSGA